MILLTKEQAPMPLLDDRERNLVKALRNVLPGEAKAPLIEILLLAAEKDKIQNDEIQVPESVKEDLLILLESENVLIPFETSKTIAWEDRVLTFKPGETYEVPHVVRYLLDKAVETGELDADYAFERYLREVGEPEPEKISIFFNKVLENVEKGRISGGTLSEIAGELSLEHRIGTIIAVLKGGGVISPCLRKPSTLSYEVNSFLVRCR